MTDDTYQGWASRETWACHLHLANDEGLYTLALDTAEAALSAAGSTDSTSDTQASVIGMALGDLVAELLDEQAYGWNETLAMMREEIGSRWRIDWTEIGAAFLPSEHGR